MFQWLYGESIQFRFNSHSCRHVSSAELRIPWISIYISSQNLGISTSHPDPSRLLFSPISTSTYLTRLSSPSLLCLLCANFNPLAFLSTSMPVLDLATTVPSLLVHHCSNLMLNKQRICGHKTSCLPIFAGSNVILNFTTILATSLHSTGPLRTGLFGIGVCFLFSTLGNISYALFLGLAVHSKPNPEFLRLWLPVVSTKFLILYFLSALMHITIGALRMNAEWNVTVKRLQEVNGGSFVLANMTVPSKVCQLVSGINKPHDIVNLVWTVIIPPLPARTIYVQDRGQCLPPEHPQTYPQYLSQMTHQIVMLKILHVRNLNSSA